MYFHFTEGQVESSRSKIRHLKLQESPLSPVDERFSQGHCGTPGAPSLRVRAATEPWNPAALESSVSD